MSSDKKNQHKKELNSLRNKMGSNIIWFDSLTVKRQYDVLFLWKREKYSNTLESVEILKIRGITIKKFPVSLKHFLKKIKKMDRFKPLISNIRDTKSDFILKNNKL